jgi:hypothetical protein
VTDYVPRPSLVELRVGDPPDTWRHAGFTVGTDASCRVGAVTIHLAGDPDAAGPRGVLAWTLAGVAVPGSDGGGTAPPAGHGALLTGARSRTGARGDLDGLATQVVDAGAAPAGTAGERTPQHPNGCVAIDHVVVRTPDLDRTTAALEVAGVQPRRTREAGTGPDGVAHLQRFFRLGEVILELVGPAEPSGDGPARFWGLAYTVADLDTTAAYLAGLVTEPRTAVQPGRRIAALRREAGLSVPTAFLSPETRP